MTQSKPRLSAGTVHDRALATAPHRITGVSLVVHDLEGVSGFYRDVIGLAERERGPHRVSLGTASTALVELLRDPSARRRLPREAGLFHTAFLLPERADLGAWLSFASRPQLRLHGASDHLVSEAIYLSDPEGNGIEIYADRPDGEWSWEGGKVRMTTDPLDAADLVRSAAGREWSGFPDDGQVGHVHLQVGAVAQAETFYGDILGFDVTCRYPGGSFFGSGGYHHQLAANMWNSRGAPARTEPSTGLSQVGISVDRDVLDAVRIRAADRAETSGPDSLALRDPWNTLVTLTAS